MSFDDEINIIQSRVFCMHLIVNTLLLMLSVSEPYLDVCCFLLWPGNNSDSVNAMSMTPGAQIIHQKMFKVLTSDEIKIMSYFPNGDNLGFLDFPKTSQNRQIHPATPKLRCTLSIVC